MKNVVPEKNSRFIWHSKDTKLIEHSCTFDEKHMDEIFFTKNNINKFQQLNNLEIIKAIPHLSALFINIRQHLLNEKGFYLLKGFPTEKLSVEEIKSIYQILGKLIGALLPQNKSKEYVVDVHQDSRNTMNGRGYLSNVELDFHTDACDIVGLLCINQANKGGASKIVSSSMIYSEICLLFPELAEVGFSDFAIKNVENLNSKSENHNHAIPLYVIENGMLLSRLVPGYTKTLFLENQLNAFEKKQLQLIECIQSIANDPRNFLEMKLAPGDIQFLNNNVIYHARTSFENSEAYKRHMIRLWIDIPEIKSYPNLFVA